LLPHHQMLHHIQNLPEERRFSYGTVGTAPKNLRDLQSNNIAYFNRHVLPETKDK
jgi:hypothetical protein